eukprot:jgi/Chrpa1/17426/Chrysochromulina_OHIO_Genome00021424-RA
MKAAAAAKWAAKEAAPPPPAAIESSGVAAETLAGVERAHQPARAITRLPPGHVAPSGHTRQALSHP